MQQQWRVIRLYLIGFIWVTLGLGIAVSSALTSLLQGYFKRRGEGLATKADFAEIIYQLKETVSTTKSIELALSRSDWIHKERNTLKRGKIEELIVSAYEAEKWIGVEVDHVLFETPANSNPTPIDRFEMISRLYLPEIRSEAQVFSQSVRLLKIQTLQAKPKLIKARKNLSDIRSEASPIIMQRASDNLIALQQQVQKSLLEGQEKVISTLAVLTDKAASQIVELTSEDE